MKLFSYNPKTKVFEYRVRDSLSDLHIKFLLAIREKRYVDHDIINILFNEDFADDDENARWQIRHDILFHLMELGLIEYKNNQNISDWNGKEHINARTVSGYFLTSMGKAFVNSLLPKDQRNKFRHND